MRRTLLLIFVVYLGLGCSFAILIPPLEASDEPHHLDYLNRIATRGRLPDQFNKEQSVYGQGHQHPLYYMVAGLIVRAISDTGVTIQPRVNPPYLKDDMRARAVPRYDHRGPSFFPTTKDAVLFYGLRFGSVLIGAINLWLLWRVADFFFPDSPWRLFALLLAATLPQFLFLSAVISNDNLANLFATATILSCLRVLEAPGRIGPYIAAGLYLGLGILAKKTILTLIPPVGLVLLLVLLRSPRSEVRRVLARALLVPALALLVSGWYFLRNRLLYGEWLASRMEEQTLPGLFKPRSLDDPYFREVFLSGLADSFVGRFGWMNVPLPVYVYLGYALLGAVALVGFFARGITTRFRDIMVPVAFAFVASTFAGIVYYNLSFPQHQGRYLFPVLSLLAVLATIGLKTVLQTVRLPRVQKSLIGGIGIALLLMDLAGLHTIHDYYWTDTGQYAWTSRGRVPASNEVGRDMPYRGAPMSDTLTPVPTGWLNRNVIGAGLTSLLADACYETATAMMPGFLEILTRQGVEVAAFALAALWLGLTEGLADGVASSVKLFFGFWSDRVGHRKGVVAVGYALTGAATTIFAAASAAWMVVVGRVVAWLGKGIRGPLRDAILADSVEPADRGKVFGFHRAGDTIGAIIGPLVGAWLLGALAPCADGDATRPYRILFLLALIPGLGAPLAFALMIREVRREPNRAARFWGSVRALPASFRRLLVGIGVFGAGDFAHSLLVLAAAELLTPEYGSIQAMQIAALLYALRNVFYAAASFPVGALSDRIGRRGLLAIGYLLGAAVIGGYAAAFALGLAHLPVLIVLFALAGTYIAFEDALSGAITADHVLDSTMRGTAYGIMGTVKGAGDLLSSVLLGVVWFTIGPVPGFIGAAVLMLAGALLLYRVR